MPENRQPGLKVWGGRHVQLELTYAPGDVERLDLDLVPDASADFEHGFLGESTPLAQAILGHVAGDVVTYQAADRVSVRILSVSADLHGQPEDLSARREEVERKAREDSDTTNLIMFASSFSGKWGDYDPGAVRHDGAESEEGPEDEDPGSQH